MDSRFTWKSLSDDAAWESLFSPTHGAEARVVRNILHYLRKRAEALGVLIENHYVDRDHRAAFSHFYSRQFRGTSSLCQRLHFFASGTPWDALQGAQTPSPDSYLGYVVQRPTPSAPIGRSVLAIEPRMIPGAMVYCRGNFQPHINDTEFHVNGVPFTQQDSMVMSCAETSIWTAARVMSKQFHHRLILPNEITRPETIGHSEYGRLLPSNGLTANQMAQALSALGFEPIHYDKQAFKKEVDPIETCIPYIVSKIPTILAFPSHAVTACGVVMRQLQQPNGDHLHSVHEWVDGLIIQDDTRGPYRVIPKDDDLHVTLHQTDLNDLLIAKPKDPRDVTYPSSWWSASKAESIIVPLPERVYLTAVDAQVFAKTTLSPKGFLPHLHQMLALLAQAGHRDARVFLEALFEGKHGGLVYSVRCRKAVDVRHDFVPASPRVREVLREVPLPRQVWAIECTTRDAFESKLKEDRILYGEFYLDATAHKYVGLSALVLARVVGAMLVRSGLCLGDDTPKIIEIREDAASYRSGIPLWSD
ncbi:MAG TPA: hypothetical protein VFT22_31100 [Kofleriaceae bacterium]|nr:hypothetical protein [Kofleriaceae bacterium]